MKRLVAACVLLFGTVSGACADDNARKLAAALKGVLDDYQVQVNKKIKAEQEAYEQAARLYASAQDETAFQSLIVDRLSLSMSSTAWLLDGTMTVNELLFEHVPAYARQDFDRTKSVFAEQTESYRAFLSNLQSLTAEKKKAAALSAALEEMNKKSGLAEWLSNLQTSGEAMAKQLKYSDCALTVSRLLVYAAQKDRLEERLKAAGLGADEKTRLENDLDAVKKRIARLEAQRKATGLYDESKKSCKSPA